MIHSDAQTKMVRTSTIARSVDIETWVSPLDRDASPYLHMLGYVIENDGHGFYTPLKCKIAHAPLYSVFVMPHASVTRSHRSGSSVITTPRSVPWFNQPSAGKSKKFATLKSMEGFKVENGTMRVGLSSRRCDICHKELTKPSLEWSENRLGISQEDSVRGQ